MYVPSAWNKGLQPTPPAIQPGLGWAIGLPLGSSGYGTPPTEMISLEISAVFEAGGKKRSTHMNTIGVSSCSTVGKLLLIQYHRVYAKD